MSNRKQRRLENKKNGKSFSPLASTQKNEAEYYKNLGMSLKNQGLELQAIEPLVEALRRDPSLADVHFTLAMISKNKPEINFKIDDFNATLSDKNALLKSYETIMDILRHKRKYNEAIICQEQIIKLNKNASSVFDLGLLYNITGETEKAASLMSEALNIDPTNRTLKGIYSTSLFEKNFKKFYPEIKTAILHCLENMYDVNLFRMGSPWMSLMAQDPDFSYLQKLFTGQKFDEWIKGLDEKTGYFLNDPYFIKGLRILIISDYAFEKFLTNLRKYICINFTHLKNSGNLHLYKHFLYAMSEHCFLNEYVYAQEEAEINAVNNITPNGHLEIALLGCYKPLYKAMPSEGDFLHQMGVKDADFSHMIKTHFDDPNEEENLKISLPVFGDFSNNISQAVQSQYEENPYPRWTTIVNIPLPNDDITVPNTGSLDILIAGCGTGRQAISAAIRHPKANITAIDLSRASLAYGKRKALEAGVLKRIKFIQADILSMKNWQGTFDLIECSGVLHHMQDPFEGWRTLTEKLKKSGYMKIGLYSEIARQPVVMARDFIKKNGFMPTPEGIRACRQAIFELHSDNPIRQILTQSTDFYTTSLVRDLIFHVQEHRMTLSQIAEMMGKLDLECIKFPSFDATIMAIYDSRYPEDTNRASFKNWAEMEHDYPLTFFNMYQFWCKKIPHI